MRPFVMFCVVVGVAALATDRGALARPGEPAVTVTSYATGLNDPRGMVFGPDRALYVAEGGSGGASESTVGLCQQVPAIGPFVGGSTGRVVRVAADGSHSVVIDGLPSSEARPDIGGDKSGAAAVEFIGQQMFTLVSGGGCSHGHANPADHNEIIAGKHGTVGQLVDLSNWLHAHPGAKGAETPLSPDYEPDGTWYSMLFDRGRLLTLEPNHGLLVSVHPQTGDIQLVRDLFAELGDHTYTSMAEDRGSLYIGTLGRIVMDPNTGIPDFVNSFAASIYRLSPNGAAEEVYPGLHAVLGLAFDKQHRLYAIQSPIFIPGTGSLVRIDPDGTIVPILTGLTFPSSIVRGPDDALYITVCGFHCSPGDGQVLKIGI